MKTYPFTVFSDEELWLHLTADSKQSCYMFMADLAKKVDFSAELKQVVLVT